MGTLNQLRRAAGVPSARWCDERETQGLRFKGLGFMCVMQQHDNMDGLNQAAVGRSVEPRSHESFEFCSAGYGNPCWTILEHRVRTR